MNIGVLALQGAFREHINSIKKCGANALEIKFPQQLNEIDGLIIPGGESTTINKLMNKYNFKTHLDDFYKSGRAIYGTCAGLILIANKIINEDFGLNYIDIDVERNAYGRQIDSFEEYVTLSFDKTQKFKAVFIRAPKITRTGPGVDILSEINDNIILVRQNNVLASTFHPELQEDKRIHEYFLKMAGRSIN
ncbi:MAG: pyridoxal 5'-phosphate synthase glutaminase subunit PdxT [Actinobacteria bacterium]|nr:pyridoxal 5'-phosphate synthase glutaminase subunit PdxT [Actinomycetota bacterium]MCL6086974.1 pyridoxal 5'-phosphate synthase glutaminase subunit PdxT [Actinomycetota bacterium]